MFIPVLSSVKEDLSVGRKVRSKNSEFTVKVSKSRPGDRDFSLRLQSWIFAFLSREGAIWVSLRNPKKPMVE